MNEGTNYLKTELYTHIKRDEAIFDFILSSSLDGLWYWDLETPQNEWMNPAFWGTLGYRPEEVQHIPKAWQKFIFPEDLKKVKEIIYTNLHNPHFEYAQEVRYHHKNGEILWLVCKGRFICNEAGKPIRMIGGHINISEAKKQHYNNTRLSAILAASSDFCFVLDKDYAFIDYHYNPLTNNELYVPISKFIGKKITEIGFPPEVLNKFLDAIKETLTNNKKNYLEYSLNVPEKGEQFYSLITSLFCYEPGMPIEILCFVQNITERKQAELALRESEERFRNVINATKDGLWEWDMETNQEFFSPRWCEIIGYDFNDASFPHTFDAWASRIHPDDYSRVMNVVNDHLNMGKVYDVEYRHLHKSGEYRWQSSRGQAVFDENGKAIKMVGCIADISERKKAEALAQQISLLHQTLLDNVPGYVVCRDYEGHFLFVNNAFSALFDKKPEEVIGLTDAEYGATPDEINYYLSADRMVMDSGKPLFIPEESVLRKDGTRGIFQATKVPINILGVEKGAVLIVATDITDLKQIQAKLIESKQQLLYKSQILSAIAKTTEKLLISKNINETLQESFDLIGKTTHLDRVYYFENEQSTHTINYKIEWVAKGVSSAMDEPQLHHVSFRELAEYLSPLLKNKPFQNITRKIKTEKIRNRLNKQKTLSILLLPIFVKNTFYGFIGFDDCKKERLWTKDELNAFNSLATNISNAIERIHNELFIEESENNFRQINETIEDVFWLYDILKNQYLYINPCCEKVVGASQTEFYAGTYKDKIHVVEEDKKTFENATNLLLQNDSYEIVYRLIIDGHVRWINEKSYAIRNEQGQLIRTSGICTDITEKVEKQNELERLLSVTNKQNDRLTNFAHIVSHNIRSHSSNLSSLIDFIETTESETEKELYLTMIKKSIDKLGETIQNLNEIITIQNNVNIPKTTLYLHQEIVSTIHALGSIVRANNATILHPIKKNITVQAIPAYLESILLNILSNALKYKSPHRDLVVVFSVQEKDNFLILSIKDNGLGIDLNKNGHKIFGMYKTFHHHKDARGIGLFITKNQIEAMGGKIEVESEVGVGTTFHIYFPT